MEIINKNKTLSDNKDSKLLTEEELKQMLSSYRRVFSNETYKYLEGLINLDFSALRDYLDDNSKESLTYFIVYKRIFVYNILNLIVNSISDEDLKMITVNNQTTIVSENLQEKLFEIDYRSINSFLINLYNARIASDEFIDDEIEKLLSKIDEFKTPEFFEEALDYYLKHKDYYEIKKIRDNEKVVNNMISTKIQYLRERILTLQNMKKASLSESDQDNIKRIGYYNDLIMSTIGLSMTDTSEVDEDFSGVNLPIIYRTYEIDRPLTKIKALVKHM